MVSGNPRPYSTCNLSFFLSHILDDYFPVTLLLTTVVIYPMPNGGGKQNSKVLLFSAFLSTHLFGDKNSYIAKYFQYIFQKICSLRPEQANE